jgi:hypothetical protein
MQLFGQLQRIVVELSAKAVDDKKTIAEYQRGVAGLEQRLADYRMLVGEQDAMLDEVRAVNEQQRGEQASMLSYIQHLKANRGASPGASPMRGEPHHQQQPRGASVERMEQDHRHVLEQLRYANAQRVTVDEQHAEIVAQQQRSIDNLEARLRAAEVAAADKGAALPGTPGRNSPVVSRRRDGGGPNSARRERQQMVVGGSTQHAAAPPASGRDSSPPSFAETNPTFSPADAGNNGNAYSRQPHQAESTQDAFRRFSDALSDAQQPAAAATPQPQQQQQQRATAGPAAQPAAHHASGSRSHMIATASGGTVPSLPLRHHHATHVSPPKPATKYSASTVGRGSYAATSSHEQQMSSPQPATRGEAPQARRLAAVSGRGPVLATASSVEELVSSWRRAVDQ